jgi:PAS domain S-box-containing protein
MQGQRKTKAQLLNELDALRRRVAELEARDAVRRQMGNTRLDSEALDHALVESLPVSVFRKDLAGRYTLANRLFCRSKGKSQQDILGKTDAELHTPELARQYQEGDRLVIESGQRFEAIEDQRLLDGSTALVQIIKMPVQDVSGEVIGVQGVLVDVTERKKAEAELRLRLHELSTIHAISQAAATRLNLDAILHVVGERLAQIFPIHAMFIALHDRDAGLVRFPYWRYYGQELNSPPIQFGRGIVSRIMQSGQPILINENFAQRSEELGVVRLTLALLGRQPLAWLGVPIHVQDQIIGVVCIQNYEHENVFTTADIRLLATIAANVGIAIQNAQLYAAAQQELVERQRAEVELRQTNLELTTRNEELDAFAHTVAHDLKNPLSRILGYADVLLDDYAELADEERQDALRIIAQNSRKMTNIIDELLLLSEIRRVDVQITRLDMTTIVAEVRQRLAGMIEQGHTEIIFPASAWPDALGYAPWMEQVWVNYLSNAIKYGGRPPRVELGAELVPGGMVRFWVHDNGGGITPEDQARLFIPFTRLDQARARGHGLGLSIVRRIVEKLGGQVGVESAGAPGQGCTFFFTLPAA